MLEIKDDGPNYSLNVKVSKELWNDLRTIQGLDPYEELANVLVNEFIAELKKRMSEQ